MLKSFFILSFAIFSWIHFEGVLSFVHLQLSMLATVLQSSHDENSGAPPSNYQLIELFQITN